MGDVKVILNGRYKLLNDEEGGYGCYVGFLLGIDRLEKIKREKFYQYLGCQLSSMGTYDGKVTWNLRDPSIEDTKEGRTNLKIVLEQERVSALYSEEAQRELGTQKTYEKSRSLLERIIPFLENPANYFERSPFEWRRAREV